MLYLFEIVEIGLTKIIKLVKISIITLMDTHFTLKNIIMLHIALVNLNKPLYYIYFNH